MIQDPGAADDGLFARDGDGNPLCWDRKAGALAAAATDSPAFKGRYTLEDGREAVPAFELLARRCLDERYAPDSAAEETGVPADTICRLAAEMAHACLLYTSPSPRDS